MKISCYTIIFPVLLLFVACGTGKESNSKAESVNDFDWLNANLDNLNLPIVFDSSFFARNSEIKNKVRVPDNYLPGTGVKEAQDRINGDLKFHLYPIGKVALYDSSILVFLFLITTNPNVPFDVEFYEVRMVSFSSNGKLISTQTVGLIEREFGYEKILYGSIADNKIELTKTEIFKNSSSNNIDRKQTLERFHIDQNGKINSIRI